MFHKNDLDSEQSGNEKTCLFRNRKIFILIGLSIILLLGISYASLKLVVEGTKNYVLTVNGLELLLDEGETTENILLQDTLPVSDEVGMKHPDYHFALTNKSKIPVRYTIYLVEDEYENKTSSSAIRYYYKRDEGEKEAVRNMTESKIQNGKFILEAGTIASNETFHYIYKMWLDYNAGNEVVNTQYSIHLEIEGVQIDPINNVSTKLFVSDNLGEACRTYDDGTDTFLVGQCFRNYVWYSGKLWRVVLKNNETGEVKLVTDNAITTIMHGQSSSNTSFKGSYIDQWLSQEFLPTLHDYKDYLVVDSIWNETANGSDKPSRPANTAIISSTVGLLNPYEYYTTYNNSNTLATAETGYLNNGIFWWLVGRYNAWNIRTVNKVGSFGFSEPQSDSLGVRPAVNLQSNIQISKGSGRIDDPYWLVGDEQGAINGTTLLSTRYSGEYVRFSNQLYRIVDVENNLTKITAVDIPPELSGTPFGSIPDFSVSDVKNSLEKYYQEHITETSKLLIEPNQTWYLGKIELGTNYKASICKTSDGAVGAFACEMKVDTVATTTIGLPRLGEIFTSFIGRGTSDGFWTLTPYDASKVWYMDNGYLRRVNTPTTELNARPSMYLKSNVVISKDNTGDGTYEHPYDIELGT